MGELVFVGLGLGDERGISLRGLEEARGADIVLADLYSSYVPPRFQERLEQLVGRSVQALRREQLEELGEEAVLEKACRLKVVLLVPGDPFIATTHIWLRVRAEAMGLKTRVVHGSSILSAAIGLSGLQNYRFGRSVTVAFPEAGSISEAPYDVVKGNLERALHTLLFLDAKAEEGMFLTAPQAMELLLSMEERRGEGVFTPTRLVVGLARVGLDDSYVKAGALGDLVRLDFGSPPHILVVPGELHFMEAQALIHLAGAPRRILEA